MAPGRGRARSTMPRNAKGGLYIRRLSPRNHPLRHELGATVDQYGTPIRYGPDTARADARAAQAAGVGVDVVRRWRRARRRERFGR